MSIRVERLTAENFSSLDALFGTSRECGLCWCMNHRRRPENEVQGADARNALHALTREGKVQGMLAFHGEACVGWCAVDPLSEQPGHDYNFWKHAESDKDTWSIHCLFIHPDFRGKGISTSLIVESIALAKDQGAKRILAFPIPPEKRKHFPAHDGEFSGRHSTFVKAGFKEDTRINDFYSVMSLDVAPA